MPAIDWKKTQKFLYQPSENPELVTVPPMPFIMIDGAGDPNAPDGAYPAALALLYALSYTIKMARLGAHPPEGYFEYVVPPLEGLWCMKDGASGVDYAHKDNFIWTAMIRQMDFVTQEVFQWAQEEVLRKKKLDPSPARLAVYDEGLCAQCMHKGPYDSEPATVERIHRFARESGLRLDYETRRHHEIYLADPRRCAPEKLRTVLRIPVVR